VGAVVLIGVALLLNILVVQKTSLNCELLACSLTEPGTLADKIGIALQVTATVLLLISLPGLLRWHRTHRAQGPMGGSQQVP
jgi:hypothetical protein